MEEVGFPSAPQSTPPSPGSHPYTEGASFENTSLVFTKLYFFTGKKYNRQEL